MDGSVTQRKRESICEKAINARPGTSPMEPRAAVATIMRAALYAAIRIVPMNAKASKVIPYIKS